MTEKRIWIGLVVVLVAVNIATLAFLWVGHYSNAPAENPRRGAGPAEYMVKRLQLDETQARQFRQARRRHFERIRPVEKELQATRRALFKKNLHARPVEDVGTELEAISLLHKKLDSLTYIHFAELRSYCTPEQSTELGRIIQGTLDRPRRQGPGRGRAE